MPPASEPVLANLLGYATGAIVFGIFLVLLLKDRAGRRLRSSTVTLVSAAMALLWNLGAVTLMAVDSFPLLVLTTSAMSLLPALLLHLILDGRRQVVVWAGYALSAAAVVLHASEPLFSGAELHRRTLQATAIGFAVLSAAAFLPLSRKRPAARQAAAAMALFLFALSFAHLHNEGETHAWAAELAVHHAGIPLALFVLMQDHRFLLLDAFLRFLANILLAALATWGAAEAAFRFGWVDYQRLPAARVALMALGSCGILVLFALARGAAQRLLTRLVFRRGDADRLLDELRKEPVSSEDRYLQWAGERVARFFEAERASDAPQPDRGLPFGLGRRAGGRPYLSEDLALLARMEAAVNERLEQHREAELKRLAAQAELRALQARIHPHFLFNALNALYGSIPRQAAAARRAVLNLSDIFRYFLQDDRSTIPLEQEIEIVRAYLEIEALRLGPKLSIELEIDEAVRTAAIPVLSVQPLVENAVKHGIGALPEGGAVRVRAGLEDGRLTVRVYDTGPGFGHSSAPGANVGLENVRQRLRLCFGEAAGLHIARIEGETVAGFTAPYTPS
jgi:hypothetical protein